MSEQVMVNVEYADMLERKVKDLQSRLASIERQAGDATEYVLAQINQRLLDQSMRWKQAAEEASARADEYRKELEGRDGPYYAELRTALARLQERLTGWENQAQIEARLRLKAESRLDTVRSGLNDVLVHNQDGKITDAEAMSTLHELFYEHFQRKVVERQKHESD